MFEIDDYLLDYWGNSCIPTLKIDTESFYGTLFFSFSA